MEGERKEMIGMEEGETKVVKIRGVWVIFVKAGLVGDARSRTRTEYCNDAER